MDPNAYLHEQSRFQDGKSAPLSETDGAVGRRRSQRSQRSQVTAANHCFCIFFWHKVASLESKKRSSKRLALIFAVKLTIGAIFSKISRRQANVMLTLLT